MDRDLSQTPGFNTDPKIDQAMGSQARSFQSKITLKNPIGTITKSNLNLPPAAPKAKKKKPMAKQRKRSGSRISVRSSARSDYPYMSRDELSAHYSRSPERDSTVGNRVRLARITKHQLIMEKINKKKRKTVQKSRKEKEKQRKMIVGRKNKIMEENRRKMLEVQWRLKLAKISTHIHKDKIKNIKWKIGGDWSNRKMRGIKRRTSNFEEKNYIWRTTKNVTYKISRTDLNKIPKEEIYETLDGKGNRRLMRKRIIESRARMRTRNTNGGTNGGRNGRRKARDLVSMSRSRVVDGGNDGSLERSELDESSFFIPETPERDRQRNIVMMDSIGDSDTLPLVHQRVRVQGGEEEEKLEESTNLVTKNRENETAEKEPKAIHSVPGSYAGSRVKSKTGSRKVKDRKSRTAIGARKRRISGISRKRQSRNISRRVRSSSKSIRSRRSKPSVASRQKSLASKIPSKKSKSRSKTKSKAKEIAKASPSPNQRMNTSFSSLNRSQISRNSTFYIDKSRSVSAARPRVRPDKRFYQLPCNDPAASQPLYDDDGDDPILNKNPLEIFHPSEDPEIEPMALFNLHYPPNFVNDNPKNYISIETSSYRISEKSGGEEISEKVEDKDEARSDIGDPGEASHIMKGDIDEKDIDIKDEQERKEDGVVG